jgi:hypothetical protein
MLVWTQCGQEMMHENKNVCETVVGSGTTTTGENNGHGDDEYCMAETCSSLAGLKEGGVAASWEAFDARPLLPKGL